MLEDHLLNVMKPARYIGHEWNSSLKDFDKASVRFALCFPDLYEVGMSNLGVRILYGLLNNVPQVVCERFFSPATDFENILRQNDLEVQSLESRRFFKDFDFIGFSLGHELTYTNVLNLLELGRIPLKSSERLTGHPLVIGGGPCVLNPEPIADFFDLFVIGEAEDAIVEIINVYSKYKDQYLSGEVSRKELLYNLAQIEGVYVPSFYEAKYHADGSIESFKVLREGVPVTVRKRFVKDLNTSFFPVEWLIPFIQIVHDRITVEIMRGCPNQCRFCQARSGYYPFRVRSVENCEEIARKLFACTGYEELSLIGLSVSDYPKIEELLDALISEFKEKGVSVSLPSIKPRSKVGGLARLIASIKKTGLTFAPEAASERMRRIINKDFDLLEFMKVLEEAYVAGYQHVKLYFLIGLPFEDQEDIEAIAKLCDEVSYLRKKVAGRPAFVNVSINALIPKPHTPFQWCAMDEKQVVLQKQAYLKNRMRNKNIKLGFHAGEMSFLEGVFSRGDRRLGEVLLAAFKKGARFDSWQEHFLPETWVESFREAGVDPQFYLKQREVQEVLPWDFIHIGIDREVLVDEFNKMIAIK